MLPSLLQEDLQKLGDVQALVGQLFEAFNVREYNIDMERSVIAELENIRLQLAPMEQVKKNMTRTIVDRVNGIYQKNIRVYIEGGIY